MDWLLKTVQPSSASSQPSHQSTSDVYSTVLQAISPHEHLKLATLVTAPGPAPAILAIVSNVDSDHEQACILLLSTSPPASLLAAIPVLTSFQVNLTERPPPIPASRGSTEPNTGNVLHCRLSVRGDQLIEVEVASADGRQALRDTIVELRRLATVAETAGLVDVENLGDWVERYLGSRGTSKSSTKAVHALTRLLIEPAQKSPVTTKDDDWPEWRRNWILERLREREGEYASRRTIRVRIGTWNVYGKMPAESLGKWLVADDEPAQLYVVCSVGSLQEIDDSSEAYIRHRPEREQRWAEVIERSLVSVGPVVKLASQQLVGLLILVFGSAEIASQVTDVQTTYLGTGTLGMGNKGATAVKLRYCDTYLTFVNSHLAAFQAEVEARNRDYSEICRRLTFSTYTKIDESHKWSKKMSVPRLHFVPGSDHASPSPLSNIFRTGAAKALVDSGQIDRLLASDQLRGQMEAGKVFEGFEEARITFKPTYKFDVGTSIYDSSEKQRIPSYTDRILYLPGRTNDVEVLSYNSDEGPKMSDHKPVGATMIVGIYEIDSNILSQVEGEMERELDGMENERMPDVGIEPEGPIELGRVVAQTGVTIMISNRRKFEVSWRLVPKLGDNEVCKEWLKISQVNGILRPDETHAVHFVLDMRAIEERTEEIRREQESRRDGLGLDSEIIREGERRENEGDRVQETLDPKLIQDVIVLSVDGGRDIFIPVNVRI
ncbi:Endonuclease/exonuclease/phosphatase [Melampsora americana]|nr:Endonuclease/exonuclease/phosphatase [Melampsora americana]